MPIQAPRRRSGVVAMAGLAAILVVVGGCGSNIPPQELTEDELVLGLAGSMSDYARSPEGFQAAFAQGAAPTESERERYRQLSYNSRRASISGDQADITVGILDADGKEIAEMTWKAVKQGEEWKLTEAPLP